MDDQPSLPERPPEEANRSIGFIQVSCHSDAGKQRKRNEDACALPSSRADKARLGTLLVLADGIGGLPGGAEASREAVSFLQAVYYSDIGSNHLGDRLRDAVGAVNALIGFKQRQLDYQKGYLTTLVAAVALSDQVWIANVGDSRAYLIQADKEKIQQLTEDHSGHVRNVKSGLASETDIASQRAGVITRAIGLSEDCQVDTYHYSWQPGDRLLLCSDGLASVPHEEIISITLKNPADDAARVLVSRAVELDGSDNCTAIVAEWHLPVEPPVQPSEDDEITLLMNPKSEPLAEARQDQEISISSKGPFVTRRYQRRSYWVGILGPILIGVLAGLSIAVLVAMILLQMDVISLNF